MNPSSFTYHRATSVEDAIAALAANPDARLLAGGHSLVPSMKLRLASPPVVVDLGGLAQLRGIRREGSTIVIGAMTPHREVEFSAELKAGCPILPEAASLIGDPMVRNRGTIGGSLAHADPAADYPASILALGATIAIASRGGRRTVEADAFFTGMFATALGPGDVLVDVRVPVAPAGTGMAYEKFAHPASRYAVAGVAAVVRLEKGACREARVAVTGACASATRLTALEAALAGKTLDRATVEKACRGLMAPGDLIGDQFASAAYRAHLVDVLARRAVIRAAERV